MKEIFQEYGGIIITVIAIVALMAVITLLMEKDGVVQTAFSDLIKGFVEKSGVVTSSTTK